MQTINQQNCLEYQAINDNDDDGRSNLTTDLINQLSLSSSIMCNINTSPFSPILAAETH